MAEKYTGIEKYIFADAYNFFLKYVNVPNDDYYCECCVADAKMLIFKYKDYPLAFNMIMSIVEQLEFKHMNRTMSGMTYEEWEKYIGDYKNASAFSPNSYNNKI